MLPLTLPVRPAPYAPDMFIHALKQVVWYHVHPQDIFSPLPIPLPQSGPQCCSVRWSEFTGPGATHSGPHSLFRHSPLHHVVRDSTPDLNAENGRAPNKWAPPGGGRRRAGSRVVGPKQTDAVRSYRVITPPWCLNIILDIFFWVLKL